MHAHSQRFGVILSLAAVVFCGWVVAGCNGSPLQEKPNPETSKTEPSSTALFDGKTLDGWEAIQFGGEGECRVEEGKLLIESGGPLTGIVTTLEDLPKTNYEISLEARQTAGLDFFCGLTFPVADSHCTFVVGGWAGSVVGLSCIDGDDASRNESRKLMNFEENRWYKIRLRVQSERIQAWIDEKQVVDQNIKDKKISLRNEVLSTAPLGICNFESDSEFKNIELRKLSEKPQEIPQ